MSSSSSVAGANFLLSDSPSLFKQLQVLSRQERLDRYTAPPNLSGLAFAIFRKTVSQKEFSDFEKIDEFKNQLIQAISKKTQEAHQEKPFIEAIGVAVMESIDVAVEYAVTATIEKIRKFDVKWGPALIPCGDEEKGILDARYRKGEVIGDYIKQFVCDPSTHTIRIEDYLDARISRTIRKVQKIFSQFGQNIHLFIGPESDLQQYYCMLKYRHLIQLVTDGSNNYFVAEHPTDHRLHKLIISGISSTSRFNDMLLRLKFADIDLQAHVEVHGTLSDALKGDEKQLTDTLNGYDPPPKLAFIGNRSIILRELASRFGVGAHVGEKDMEDYLSHYHGHNRQQAGIFKFSYVKAKIGNEEAGIIGFRMPNGDLAYKVTQSLLKVGVDKIVLVGAGGSLKKAKGVGSYQLTHFSTYQNIHRSLQNTPALHPMPVPQDLTIHEGCKNCTVDSPLVETQGWQKQQQEAAVDSVDVETNYIFKAIEESAGNITYFPGIFISDVVGEHPLTEKISPANAHAKLPNLVRSIFDHLNVEA